MREGGRERMEEGRLGGRPWEGGKKRGREGKRGEGRK